MGADQRAGCGPSSGHYRCASGKPISAQSGRAAGILAGTPRVAQSGLPSGLRAPRGEGWDSAWAVCPARGQFHSSGAPGGSVTSRGCGKGWCAPSRGARRLPACRPAVRCLSPPRGSESYFKNSGVAFPSPWGKGESVSSRFPALSQPSAASSPSCAFVTFLLITDVVVWLYFLECLYVCVFELSQTHPASLPETPVESGPCSFLAARQLGPIIEITFVGFFHLWENMFTFGAIYCM